MINLYLCPKVIGLTNVCPLQYRRYEYSQSNCPTPYGITKSELALMNKFRMLWEQHVLWTRIVITGIVFDLPGTDSATRRLLQNPLDFEAVLKKFYGDEIASKFSNLFTDHLLIAANLVNAAKAGNSSAAADAEKEWYANADEIAAFLGSINPYWSEDQWKDMLHRHLELTKSEAVDLLTKNYEASITTYDEIERQALEMADMMAKGIIKQFPEKFTR